MSIAWGDSPRIRLPARLGTAAAAGYTIAQALHNNPNPGNWLNTGTWWPKPKKPYGPPIYVPSSQPDVLPNLLRPTKAWWRLNAAKRLLRLRLFGQRGRPSRHYRRYPKFRRTSRYRGRFYRKMLQRNVPRWRRRGLRRRYRRFRGRR